MQRQLMDILWIRWSEPVQGKEWPIVRVGPISNFRLSGARSRGRADAIRRRAALPDAVRRRPRHNTFPFFRSHFYMFLFRFGSVVRLRFIFTYLRAISFSVRIALPIGRRPKAGRQTGRCYPASVDMHLFSAMMQSICAGVCSQNSCMQ